MVFPPSGLCVISSSLVSFVVLWIFNIDRYNSGILQILYRVYAAAQTAECTSPVSADPAGSNFFVEYDIHAGLLRQPSGLSRDSSHKFQNCLCRTR